MWTEKNKEKTGQIKYVYKWGEVVPKSSRKFAMEGVFTSLALMLHLELERRAGEATISELSEYGYTSSATRTGNPPQTPWETARIDFLRSQARALALSALPNLLRLLKLQEFPFYALSMMWTMMTGWAELCADEADRCGGIAGVLAATVPGAANFNADEIPEVYA